VLNVVEYVASALPVRLEQVDVVDDDDACSVPSDRADRRFGHVPGIALAGKIEEVQDLAHDVLN